MFCIYVTRRYGQATYPEHHVVCVCALYQFYKISNKNVNSFSSYIIRNVFIESSWKRLRSDEAIEQREREREKREIVWFTDIFFPFFFLCVCVCVVSASQYCPYDNVVYITVNRKTILYSFSTGRRHFIRLVKRTLQCNRVSFIRSHELRWDYLLH